MGEGDAEVEAPAFMPGEDVHFWQLYYHEVRSK